MKKTEYRSFEEAFRHRMYKKFRGEEDRELDQIILDAPLEEDFTYVWSPYHTGIRDPSIDKKIRDYYGARGFEFKGYDEGDLEWEKEGKRYIAYHHTTVFGDRRDDHREIHYMFFEIPIKKETKK
tara:strand:- start:2255 stop:2629 length:375 start_codon:yes stop_codon:yes gene_type:complete